MSHPQRFVIFDLALAAAWSDGAVCESEVQALVRVMEHLGYSADEISAWTSAPLEPRELTTLAIPAEPAARLEAVRYAMAVTMADGALEDSELQFLGRLAQHLKLNPQVLSLLCAEAQALVGRQGVTDTESFLRRVETLLPSL